MKDNKPTRISSDSRTKFTAKAVAAWNNRGQSSVNLIRTTLNHLREETGLTNLKKLEEAHVRAYVEALQDALANDDLSRASTSNRISALNTVLHYLDRDNWTVSAREHGLNRGGIDKSDKSNTQEASLAFREWLMGKNGDVRYQALRHSIEMQSAFGLRARESFAIKITQKNPEVQTLEVTKKDLPKNARPRTIQNGRALQQETIRSAREFAGANGMRSLIPEGYDLSQWKGFAYRAVNEFREETGQSFHFHGERHRYAHERYTSLWQEKTGVPLHCPARHQNGDWLNYARQQTGLSKKALMDLDREIRMVVSQDLGHARLNITRAYLG